MGTVQHVVDWRRRTKARMILAMGGKCQICGYNKCNSSLGFHHVNKADKSFGVASSRGNTKSWVKIVE